MSGSFAILVLSQFFLNIFVWRKKNAKLVNKQCRSLITVFYMIEQSPDCAIISSWVVASPFISFVSAADGSRSVSAEASSIFGALGWSALPIDFSTRLRRFERFRVLCSCPPTDNRGTRSDGGGNSLLATEEKDRTSENPLRRDDRRTSFVQFRQRFDHVALLLSLRPTETTANGTGDQNNAWLLLMFFTEPKNFARWHQTLFQTAIFLFGITIHDASAQVCVGIFHIQIHRCGHLQGYNSIGRQREWLDLLQLVSSNYLLPHHSLCMLRVNHSVWVKA